jgi:hypothetical protein
MKIGYKYGIFSPKNAGTWRSTRGIPDVSADYVGRPTRLGKLVELLLTEDACRTREASQEERGNFFLQKCSPPATRRTWWLLAAMRCVEVLGPARGACNANAPEMTTVCWPEPPWCAGGSPHRCVDADSNVSCPEPRVRTISLHIRQRKILQHLTTSKIIVGR